MQTPDNYLEHQANQMILRYAIQRAIFCPSCEIVLDIKSAALMTVKKDGQDAYTRIMCGNCYEKFDKNKFLAECKAKLPGELSLEFITNFKPKKAVSPIADLSKYIKEPVMQVYGIGEKYNEVTKEFSKVKHSYNGRKVILSKEFNAFTFFIYQNKNNKWAIIEETTGLGLCSQQESESAAIKLALSRLKKVGLDDFKQIVERTEKIDSITTIEPLPA